MHRQLCAGQLPPSSKTRWTGNRSFDSLPESSFCHNGVDLKIAATRRMHRHIGQGRMLGPGDASGGGVALAPSCGTAVKSRSELGMGVWTMVSMESVSTAEHKV